MSKLLSALVGVSMLGSVAAASAAVPLTEAQMDGVTAGITITPILFVASSGTFDAINGPTLTFNTQTLFVISE
jgi:FlaG/FlaF family flagellin (archaellin)